MPWLMGLAFLPFISSIVVLCSLRITKKQLKALAVLLSLLPLLLLLYQGNKFLGAVIDVVWFPALSIHWHLSIDSLSLLFLFLTGVVTPVSLMSLKSDHLDHPKTFYALILFLQGLLILFFTVRDLALFTLFYEGMLLPLYFMINLWGKLQRRQVSLKFLIYMMAGSALMLAAVLGIFLETSTFNLDQLQKNTLPFWAFAIFMLAFAVKTPLFPFHAWLPDTYAEAPIAGTILLSALLSKAGIYGILRISISLFPQWMVESSPWLIALAIAGVFYGALNAWMETDFKRLLAYSSLSHVNFILVGLFIWNETAHKGAILQAVNHGVTITALFLVAGWLEERLGSTSMLSVSGLAKIMPRLCWLTFIFVLASVAVPGTNNFIGELLILFGLFGKSPWITAILGVSIILSVIYMLRFMQKIYFQIPMFNETWKDISTREFVIAFPFLILTFWIGLYPTPVLGHIIHYVGNLK